MYHLFLNNIIVKRVKIFTSSLFNNIIAKREQIRTNCLFNNIAVRRFRNVQSVLIIY